MDLQRLAIFIAIILMMNNSMYFFLSQMPANQAGTEYLGSYIGSKELKTINGSMTTLINDQTAALESLNSDSNVEASLEQKPFFLKGVDFLFGPTGGVSFAIKYLTTLTSGANMYIDMFLPPALPVEDPVTHVMEMKTNWWGFALGWLIKPIFIFIQLIGMMFLVGWVFSMGTGNKL